MCQEGYVTQRRVSHNDCTLKENYGHVDKNYNTEEETKKVWETRKIKSYV